MAWIFRPEKKKGIKKSEKSKSEAKTQITISIYQKFRKLYITHKTLKKTEVRQNYHIYH